MPRDRGRQNHMRARIAAVAARLMAEDGIDDIAMAKRKAPVSRGGRVSVACLAAALFTPQITTTATMAAISVRDRGLCGLSGEVTPPT